MEENLKQQSTTVTKITLFGPESTGKSTLAKDLAIHYKTGFVPEFARDYLQKKWDLYKQVCEPEDLIPIAVGQTKLENERLLTAFEYLFCDTNVLTTKVFSELYYNFCDPNLDEAAKTHQYDLFLLTDIDVPWEKDDLRDRPNGRDATFSAFKDALIQNNKPFIILSGNKEERLKQAINIIDNLKKARDIGFSSTDFVQIYTHGIDIDRIQEQLQYYHNGVEKVNIIKPASIDDGILKYTDDELLFFIDLFETKKANYKLKKFVPASGAASRMFKFLHSFLNEFDIAHESINKYIIRKKDNDLAIFLAGIEKFPFYKTTIKSLTKKHLDFNNWSKDLQHYFFIKEMLDDNALNFANKPKSVLPFHLDGKIQITPIEEHLKEAVQYAASNNNSYLHFTVSKEHKTLFENTVALIKNKIEQNSSTSISLKYSYQNQSTDAIGVNEDNSIFRNNDGKIVFRPSGHGALIENLNHLDADVVFIKNIDNIISKQTDTISFYKKALAGILIKHQIEIFDYLNQIENNKLQIDEMRNIVNFAKNTLNLHISNDFDKYTLENKIDYLYNLLNRPIRICGMVKNEGEAGGGPFWVLDKKGEQSLQIVETSQIDKTNLNQKKRLESATHFNPVDLVCGLKNYKNTSFDLNLFVDKECGFIVQKNKDGRQIKAYEMPGLWNGAMSKWITIFVEVPLITFNPVKTVNDLLKSSHQE